MGRKPKKAEFMTFSKIVDYAIDTYPVIKLQTEVSDVKDGRKNVYNYILKAFIRHGLIADQNDNTAVKKEKTDIQNNGNQNISPVSKNNVSKQKFSLVVAKSVIEHDVCTYYQKSPSDFSMKTKHRFEEADRQMREKYIQSFADHVTDQVNERDGLLLDVIPDDKNPEKNAGYHIQIAGFDAYTNEFEDEVVVNIMRQFINENYDFHEEEYRKDLKKVSERLGMIYPLYIHDGYSEQIWKLEHPFGNYIFPKDKKNSD